MKANYVSKKKASFTNVCHDETPVSPRLISGLYNRLFLYRQISVYQYVFYPDLGDVRVWFQNVSSGEMIPVAQPPTRQAVVVLINETPEVSAK